MTSEIKIVYRKKRAGETVYAEKELYENLKEPELKYYMWFIQRIIAKGYYDSVDEHLYILKAIERILDGYKFEIYPEGRKKKQDYNMEIAYLNTFEDKEETN